MAVGFSAADAEVGEAQNFTLAHWQATKDLCGVFCGADAQDQAFHFTEDAFSFQSFAICVELLEAST